MIEQRKREEEKKERVNTLQYILQVLLVSIAVSPATSTPRACSLLEGCLSLLSLELGFLFGDSIRFFIWLIFPLLLLLLLLLLMPFFLGVIVLFALCPTFSS